MESAAIVAAVALQLEQSLFPFARTCRFLHLVIAIDERNEQKTREFRRTSKPPDAARKWRDTAGIEAIAAKSNSRFAAELRKTANLRILGVPLHVALQDLSKQHGIAIRLAPDVPSELANRPMANYDGGTSLAAALGRMLEEHDLCCEDQGDELLVRALKRGPTSRP